MSDAVTAGCPRVWSRRALLALTGVGLGAATLPRPARAASIGVGDLLFDVPAAITERPADVPLGQGWQWIGGTSGATLLPTTLVFARSDLPSTDASEVLGLLLGGSAAGVLPNLEVEVLRTRPMTGGGEQVRTDLAYEAQPGLTYHGTLLVATRPDPPTAVVAVLGDNGLTAGAIDTILSSVRWRS